MNTARNALRILREFSQDKAQRGVSEIARSLGLDRSTVHRLLRTLVDEGLVEQDAATRLYRLGPGVVEFARNFLSQNRRAGIAIPSLRKLCDTTGESAGIQLLDGHEAVWIAASESSHPLRVACREGERVPIHCTSPGLVFLAFNSPTARASLLVGDLKKYTPKTIIDKSKIASLITQVRAEGVAMTDSTYMPDIRAVSAPIRAAHNREIAAVTIVASSRRVSLTQLAGFANLVREAASSVSTDMTRFGSLRAIN
jgi:DNA-binding IclR family transcriptional regulator